ncbi:bifunctional 2-polyprenyl-6-hydroxyphenol methylase/3-demethylubiquinol 3-O-methyltransferase UbiG [Magnetospirillum sp. UT-4]|uniref:bifunctional 2-polyprenyl-6-hydroxyphenol methylase/3-demethylubiquinol 3-O-methyltransferase UbiG n=1 Tax=Magnetospirillum sp. UT-4 TaxID=2681467 RepID=UPI00138396B4|nr:bifunctional 2-polyprenyl-6-hydroxyphenol methylase/3-demethylubiquinol 3-O-methyltransferase UbiG [Magnetospirillum sp. UT-4]CAA7616937.1 Ubiquinone biosynthesis O-methyltransferase [Magnetospirillum sp. UT-4]
MANSSLPKRVPPARIREREGTASSEEVARFTAMAEAWWDPWGKFKPLHKFNPVRLAFMRRKLAAHFGRDEAAARPFEGLTLLDVGCGGGLLSEPLARMGFTVTGVDAGDKNIGVARIHAAQSDLAIDYRIGGPEDMDSAAFDVVIAMEVIEHVPDPAVFLGHAARTLKPGGAFMGATLNRTTKSYALAVMGAEYILRWLPAGTHDWRKFVKPSEFAAFLRAEGIEISEMKGMEYVPFKDEWHETRDLDVNYMLFGTKG